MKATRMAGVAAVIAASGLVLHVARAQQPGSKRIDLQRHDLSVPGREVVQAIVELEPGVTSSGTRIRAKRSSMFSKGRRWSTRSKESRR